MSGAEKRAVIEHGAGKLQTHAARTVRGTVDSVQLPP